MSIPRPYRSQQAAALHGDMAGDAIRVAVADHPRRRLRAGRPQKSHGTRDDEARRGDRKLCAHGAGSIRHHLMDRRGDG